MGTSPPPRSGPNSIKMTAMTHGTNRESHNLRYVKDMLEQLKVVAQGGGSPFLVYLIDLARHEAAEKLRLGGSPFLVYLIDLARHEAAEKLRLGGSLQSEEQGNTSA
ncbi:hypothetical protein Sa4125_20210 [Aureimonas sp. SA4125]|uniref:hypothetical protein n=1 Tax=Aureimonas sp. SA4125 TaxID=2826993 RepID=UPI001CC44C9F|nr:hypothetical protein [Aureimonas sp. SA4125]BDA84479.1 hypothetical protein Sa4125_20210 [Aureimonas sp. SA4125]